MTAKKETTKGTTKETVKVSKPNLSDLEKRVSFLEELQHEHCEEIADLYDIVESSSDSLDAMEDLDQEILDSFIDFRDTYSSGIKRLNIAVTDLIEDYHKLSNKLAVTQVSLILLGLAVIVLGAVTLL